MGELERRGQAGAAGESPTSEPSVSLSANCRSAVVVCPASSVAVTVKCQFALGRAVAVPLERVHARLLGVLRERDASPGSGPMTVAVTCDGRTSLYENVCTSSTPSPFGESVVDAGGAA